MSYDILDWLRKMFKIGEMLLRSEIVTIMATCVRECVATRVVLSKKKPR